MCLTGYFICIVITVEKFFLDSSTPSLAFLCKLFLLFISYTLSNFSKSLCCLFFFFLHLRSLVRVLIKNFTDQALDVAWSFSLHPVYLAVIVQSGSLFVYTVD